MQPPLSSVQQALAKGGQAAAELLWDTYGARLHAWLSTVADDRHQAEDALQEVFCQALRHPERLAQAVHLDAYVFAMARHAVSRLRRRRVRPLSVDDNYLEHRDTQPGQRDDDERRLLQAALRCLPPEQREVVALKCFDDQTFASIATLLGISANTAASRYRYALIHLRNHLGKLRHVF